MYEFELRYRRFFDIEHYYYRLGYRRKALISKNLRYRGASISKYRPSISKFLHFCVLRYDRRSMPTRTSIMISKYRPSISKLHIVPDIEAKTLTSDIEGLVFDIVHISISGILIRYPSLARFRPLADDSDVGQPACQLRSSSSTLSRLPLLPYERKILLYYGQ